MLDNNERLGKDDHKQGWSLHLFPGAPADGRMDRRGCNPILCGELTEGLAGGVRRLNLSDLGLGELRQVIPCSLSPAFRSTRPWKPTPTQPSHKLTHGRSAHMETHQRVRGFAHLQGCVG